MFTWRALRLAAAAALLHSAASAQLQVVSTQPADAAVGVPTDAMVSAVFSAPLLPASVNADSFRVARGGALLGGVISVEDRTATFSPSPRLCPFAGHQVTLTTQITDLKGVPLGDQYAFSFATGDGTWDDSAQHFDGAPNFNSEAQVGADGNGNSLAVWQQLSADSSAITLWASRYSPASGWSDPEQIGGPGAGLADLLPRLAVSRGGSAIVVWQQHDGQRTSMWANRLAPSSGWEGALLLETDDRGPAFDPEVAIDAAGNAVAVWRQDIAAPYPDPGAFFQVYAAQYVPGVGWSAPGRVSDRGTPYLGEETGVAYTSHVAVNDAGDVAVTWRVEVTNTGSKVMARLASAGTWGPAAFLDTCAPPTCGSILGFTPRVGLDEAGNAIVVWAQLLVIGGQATPFAARYSGGSWTPPYTLRTSELGAFKPQLALHPSGRALAVWEYPGAGSANIYASFFDPASDWQEAVLLTGEKGFGARPAPAYDDAGNALVLWDDQSNIYANRFVAGLWGGPTVLQRQNSARDVRVAVTPGCGNALAVWWGEPMVGSRSVSAVRFH